MAKNQPDYRVIATQMTLLGSFEDFDTDQMIEVLVAADEAYHSSGEPIMEDSDYDAMRRYCQTSDPTNPYFIGVGSDVRGGKIPLPYPMGSLDQVEVGEIAKWVSDNDLRDEHMVTTDKLDGASAMVVYDEEGNFQIAYSRGNGTEGADISRHMKHIVPTKIDSGGEAFIIRGEVIISKTNFPIIQGKVRTSGGDVYKNARNMVSGCMNASSREAVVYKYIDFVAYEIVRPLETGTHTDDLATLKDLGFKTVHNLFIANGADLDDEGLAGILTERREKCDYEIDGLVIGVDNPFTRDRLSPTRDSLNPGHAIKYKVQDASNLAIAEVVEVEWNASKHGYLKPRVRILPVQLVGVTVQHATGFNAKFISDNGIGPGAKVQITRSGDVIPFIQEVIEPTTAGMPSGFDWEWNETGVDAVLTGEKTDEVIIGQMVAFFDSIDAPLLKTGNVTKLHETGFDVAQIIQADEAMLCNVIGSNGSKVYAGLRAKLTNIPLYRLLGAFSNERGLGVRKMKKLQQALGHDEVLNLATDSYDRITAVEGFEHKTAQKVVVAVHEFHMFEREIVDHFTYDKTGGFNEAGGELDGQKVVFTGFRDKGLQAAVEAQGGSMQSAVSGKTNILVASNPTSNSGKMKKARDLGVRVIGIDELKDILGAS